MAADFGFAGMYKHVRSGLNLAVFRAHSALWGRWLSRDPLETDLHTSQYSFVLNDPINLIDPLGLKPNTSVYSSPTVAAMAAFTENQLQQKSSASGHEFGFWVYSNRDQCGNQGYSYSNPFQSSGKQLSAQDFINAGYRQAKGVAGIGHTHPDLRPANFQGQGYETFSGTDMTTIDATGITGYLSNAYGQVRIASPGATTDIIISGPLSPGPATNLFRLR